VAKSSFKVLAVAAAATCLLALVKAARS